jgi:hypothetical protein
LYIEIQGLHLCPTNLNLLFLSNLPNILGLHNSLPRKVFGRNGDSSNRFLAGVEVREVDQLIEVSGHLDVEADDGRSAATLEANALNELLEQRQIRPGQDGGSASLADI